VQKVIGLGHATPHEGRNKGRYPNLHDLKKIREDCMLIHHGEMVAILLLGFIASTETSEHVDTLGDLFRYGGTISRSCSRESRMVLFGTNFVVVILLWIGPHPSPAQTQRMDANSKNLFSHDAWFSFPQVPAHCKKC
jgi:hypothetical protein